MTLSDDLQAVRTELKTVLGRVERLIATTNQASDESTNIDLASITYRTEAIERVLDDTGKVMRPVEIWKALTAAGRNDPKMEIQVTTYDLWQRGRIDRIGRGQYKAKPKIAAS